MVVKILLLQQSSIWAWCSVCVHCSIEQLIFMRKLNLNLVLNLIAYVQIQNLCKTFKGILYWRQENSPYGSSVQHRKGKNYISHTLIHTHDQFRESNPLDLQCLCGRNREPNHCLSISLMDDDKMTAIGWSSRSSLNLGNKRKHSISEKLLNKYACQPKTPTHKHGRRLPTVKVTELNSTWRVLYF